MNYHNLFRWGRAFILLFLVSCNLTPAVPTFTPTNTRPPQITLAPQSTDTPRPAPVTPTARPTDVPRPTPTPSSDVYKDWLKYTHVAYGFSFRHPPDWTVQEVQGQHTMSGHAIWLTPRATPLVRMQVAFKRADESVSILRTGVGAGDIVQRGSVTFLDQPINREVLVLGGKDLSVLYAGAGEIRRGDLVFSLGLDYRGLPTDPSALSQDVKAIADRIVASFDLVK